MRIIQALFGVGSIWICFLVATELFTKRVGYIFAIFVATGYWFVTWSQQIRGYSALLFFVLLFFYYLIITIRTKNITYIWLTTFALVCAILSKNIGIFLVIPFFYTILRCGFWRKKIIFVMLISVLILFVVLVGVRFEFNEQNYLINYIKGYFIDEYKIFFILALTGYTIAFLKDRKNKIIHEAIGLLIFCTIFLLSFFVDIVEKRYVFFLSLFVFLYVSFLINFTFAKIKNSVWWIIGVVIILFIYGVINSIFIIAPQKQYNLEYYTPQPNFKKAYLIFEKYKIKQDDVIISPTPWMDLIYIKKSDYALVWSLTGKGSDTTIGKNGRERYSGVKRLTGVNEKKAIDMFGELRAKNDIFIIIDDLSARRINREIYNYIKKCDVITEEREVKIYNCKIKNKL
jgi:hypothetical protein